jgi:CO/xanthine dehydrogenase Mo-binding subunit
VCADTLKNVYREGSTTPTGQVPDSLSLPEMFEKLRPKYEEAKARAQTSSTDGHKCGVGLSVGIYGCGLALSEDFEDLKKHASMMGAGFPYVQTIPDDIELIYVESPREHGPFGASGVGELPLPRILARICDHPCEEHCIRTRVEPRKRILSAFGDTRADGAAPVQQLRHHIHITGNRPAKDG